MPALRAFDAAGAAVLYDAAYPVPRAPANAVGAGERSTWASWAAWRARARRRAPRAARRTRSCPSCAGRCCGILIVGVRYLGAASGSSGTWGFADPRDVFYLGLVGRGAHARRLALTFTCSPRCARARQARAASSVLSLRASSRLAEIVERQRSLKARSRIILPHAERDLMSLSENTRHGHRFAHVIGFFEAV